jgi:hypothetical protein
MGNKVSAITGVKSPNFLKPGNAVNEIWVGDLEVVSRLPFGDSDMAQAGWPKGDWPKIPWHPFIIPFRARLQEALEKITASSVGSYQRWESPLENISRIRTTFVSLILIQILTIPLCMVPIFLVSSPNDILSRLWKGSLCHFQARRYPTRNQDGRLAKMRRVACLSAVIGSLSFGLALLLAIGDGYAISATHFCGTLSEWSGGPNRLCVLFYIIYGGVPGAFLIAATFSVFCLWRRYLRIGIKSLVMFDAGNRRK